MRENTRNHWKEQIKRTASEIKEGNDFSFIDRFIKDKRIILLGENSHGIADYFTIKTDLIRYLCQNHGFNIVIFESGLLEATLCRQFLSNDSPEKQIQNSLLDIYHNEEMIPLFSEEWAQTIILGGMDPQPTYPLISELMLDWIKDHTDYELYESMRAVEKHYFELQDEMLIKITKPLKKRMKVAIQEYENLLKLLKIKQKNYKNPEIQRMLLLIQRGMQNRLQWLQVNLKGYLSSGIQRGFNMFQNLEWLMNHYYKNEKIIVWAHNFHIRKKRPLMAKLLGIKSVGYWLQKKYPEDIFVIGLYAGNGKFATQLRVELEIDIKKKRHLESLLYETSESDLFIPLDVREQSADKKMWFKRRWWLLESGFSGFYPMALYPQDHYDAIIFIREVTSPNYLQRSE
ncbi:erythromycin esterase family protein [Bacillus norwichensis]|uniref:Erythromycin esterase family protein n=1 Tax=Bacillus norwichensis TaxID=2762217 RepID=A0ABR8VNU4_9BACI|nr:erythromycin esterase family protein [Bacillus norwichensis]MBD8006236.1 erythromycin esterase family protein [Bacillus norwichensis]